MIKKIQTLLDENVKPKISITEIMILLALALIMCALAGTLIFRDPSPMRG